MMALFESIVLLAAAVVQENLDLKCDHLVVIDFSDLAYLFQGT